MGNAQVNCTFFTSLVITKAKWEEEDFFGDLWLFGLFWWKEIEEFLRDWRAM